MPGPGGGITWDDVAAGARWCAVRALNIVVTAASLLCGDTQDACKGEEDDCDKADDECYEECEYHLGRDRMSQGTPYRTCWINCMKRKGCYKGDS